MKRIVICVFLIMCFCLSFACQPTPETDAVKQKDTNVLIDIVHVENQKLQDAGAMLSPVKEQFPDSFQCNFITSVQNVHVIADVSIEVLTDSAFPMFRVERRTLSSKERMMLAQRLLDSKNLYIFEESVTRKDIADWIAMYIQEPSAEEKEKWMREENGTEEEWQEMQKRRQDNLAKLQQQYNELPDDDAHAPLIPWDGSVPEYDEFGLDQYRIVSNQWPVGYWWSQNMIEIYANEMDRAIEYQMGRSDENDVTNVDFFDYSHKTAKDRINPNDYNKPHDGAAVTPNDAANLVRGLLNGYGEFAIADVYWANNAATDGGAKGIKDNTRWAYLLHMTPVFGSAYSPYCAASAMDDDEDADVVWGWDYENLIAVVDGDGNIVSLAWRAPLRITDTISQSTPLLSYEEIQRIFEVQMNREFAYELAKDATVTVDTAQLGMFRIREQNDLNSGLLVPVWFFTGTIEYKNGGTDYKDGHSPLLIINAIDGSIINPDKGY